ncbi:MAG: ATP-binding cassette domain-containing protein [Rhodopila sp.]
MNIATFDAFADASLRFSANGARLHLHGVKKSIGANAVLHGIDLDIPPGQFVAIVGRSGCGKSTLLRLLGGLDRPTSGQIEIDGATSGWDDHVRLMFQEPRLLPWQRVAANVAVGLSHAPRCADRKQEAQEALEQVGLGPRGGDWPSVLSGGQKQRVALARALVSHPRVLAFDEPLGALDALTRLEMQSLIEQVWQDKGFTAIVVTHDVSEAVTLADRILLLDHGRVAMDILVDLPRPRRHGDPQAAEIEGHILDRLLSNERRWS